MENTIRETFVLGQETDPITRPAQYRRTILDSNSRLWMTCALFIADMSSLFAAVLLPLELVRINGKIFEPNNYGIFILLAITLAIAFARRGLYPAVGMNYVNELREIFSSASFAFLILIGITFLLKTTSIYSRFIMLIAWVLTLALIPIGRYTIRNWLIRLNCWGEPVAIVGELNEDVALAEYFEINPQLGLRPVAILRDELFPNDNSNLDPSLAVPQIKKYARGLALNTVLVVINDLNQLDAVADRYRFVFERVILLKGRNGSYSIHSLKSLDFSNVLGLQVMNNLLNSWAQLEKRTIDLLGSILGLLFLAPFLGLTALLIRIDSPGGTFYRQPRLGRNGKVFNMLKFRTMYRNADQILTEKLAHDPFMHHEWVRYQKLRNDPRVTRMGRLLRKFSLDELPQLWNVLVGEMSLVGPRPMMTNQSVLYGVSYNEYTQVAPGITGLWQVSGRNKTTFARRAELDTEYIQRWSLWLDILILFKTIKVVLWQDGAY